MMQNKTVDAFDQFFAQRPQPTIEAHLVAIEHALRADMFDTDTHPVTHFYAHLGWETAAHRQSESVAHEIVCCVRRSALHALWGEAEDSFKGPREIPFPNQLARASTSVAFASLTASLLAEIRLFVAHNKPFTTQRFAEFLRSLPKILRKGLEKLAADLGVAAIGTGAWHLVETLVASYLASWNGIFESLRQSALSVARAIYAFACGDGSIRARVHAALIEVAAALSAAISAAFQAVLNTSFSAPLIAALAGYTPWLNAIISGALFAAMVSMLYLTDVAGVIRERGQALMNAETARALAAAERSAQIAEAAIERTRNFYESLGIHYCQ